MQSVIENVGGFPIGVLEYSLEAETGCKRAIPDNQHALSLLIELFNKSKEELMAIGKATRQKSLTRYNWDNTANKWAEHFLSLPNRPLSSTWHSPIKISDLLL
jgi:glycosyltransferase involved in cell wall biosynthesis